jgi:hypothetical protein
MADIKFEIRENIGVLSESAKGWFKELTSLAGTIENRSMILESGIQTMRRWARESR